MQQAIIQILDEMIKEANKNHNNRHHTDTIWMYFDDCESNILSLAKSRISALWESRDDRFIEISDRKSESAYHRWWKEWQAKAMEVIIDFEKNKLTPNPIIISKWDGWIKIWDEFPEDNTEVLVIDDEWIDISQWFASEHSWTWLWLHSRRKFTHWMPLPLPPK